MWTENSRCQYGDQSTGETSSSICSAQQISGDDQRVNNPDEAIVISDECEQQRLESLIVCISPLKDNDIVVSTIVAPLNESINCVASTPDISFSAFVATNVVSETKDDAVVTIPTDDEDAPPPVTTTPPDISLSASVATNVVSETKDDAVVTIPTDDEDAPPPVVAPDKYNKAKIEAEVRDELAHPDDIFITQAQYKLDKECAAFAARAHLEGKTVDLQVAKTAFYLSSFHFKEDNHCMMLYTDPSAGSRRQEWVDFFRRRNDGYVLYLWDQRIAIMLTIKNSETNTYQPRFFVAMTNLYMQMGGGNVHKELVLLDILVRMDIHSHVDALVGVIATGEVRLWKYSKDHLRFLHCDFMNEIERGENFWIAKRHQFYEEKGLIYLPQRMIPRDLDAPRVRFAISKEYITNYKRIYSSESELQKNFDKWTLLPGRVKSLSEFADKAKVSGSRHEIASAAAEKERSDTKAKDDATKKRNEEINKKRQETRKKNQEEKRLEEERKILSKHQAGEKRVANPPQYFGKLSLPPHNLPHNPQHQQHNHPPPPPPAAAVINPIKSHYQSSTNKRRQQDFISSSSSTVAESSTNKKYGGGTISHQRERGNKYPVNTLLYYYNNYVYSTLLDCNSDDSESIAQAQEKITLMARQREEAKLKHIALMHKIEEDQEKQEQQNAEARADIKRKREAADIETVSITIIYLLFYFMMMYNDYHNNRHGAKMNLRYSRIKRLKSSRKRKRQCD